MTRGIRDEDHDDKHEIDDCKAVGSTDKALRVETPDHGNVWVPKSVIHDDSEVYDEGHEGRLVVRAWWAEKQGW
jgi:hypothetical protein